MEGVWERWRGRKAAMCPNMHACMKQPPSPHPHTHANTPKPQHPFQAMLSVTDKDGRFPEKRVPFDLLPGPPAKLEAMSAELSVPCVDLH